MPAAVASETVKLKESRCRLDRPAGGYKREGQGRQGGNVHASGRRIRNREIKGSRKCRLDRPAGGSKRERQGRTTLSSESAPQKRRP
jgi:hypothetical protein